MYRDVVDCPWICLCMSSLHYFILGIVLPMVCGANSTSYFTQSIYHLWCQENRLIGSFFLYPERIIPGISRRSNNIRSIVYQLIDQENPGLFIVHNQRLGDVDLFLLNITRPLDINREYQDIYRFVLRAQINTDNGNLTDQAEVCQSESDAWVNIINSSLF